MSEAKILEFEQRGNIGVITFNRPERRNALSAEMLLALHDALEAWARADQVRVVVITGGGEKAFSSGYDISAIPTEESAELAARLRDSNPLQLGLTAVKQYPYPTIAMLNGACFGAALNLALCCDLRIGADDIAIGMPPAKLGIVYPYDGIAQFVSVLGMARARQAFFTGRTYRGDAILEMGLADRLVARAELESSVFSVAEEIAGNAPLALRGMKRALNLVEEVTASSQAAREEVDSLVVEAMQSEDAREAQRAFVEKRTPHFVGR